MGEIVSVATNLLKIGTALGGAWERDFGSYIGAEAKEILLIDIPAIWESLVIENPHGGSSRIGQKDADFF
jgi:hypothetical protein